MTACSHSVAEDVITSGELVAKVCATCWEQLPTNWGCEACEWIEEWSWGRAHPVTYPGRRCTAHRTDHPLLKET